jgi:hypothetical protein
VRLERRALDDTQASLPRPNGIAHNAPYWRKLLNGKRFGDVTLRAEAGHLKPVHIDNGWQGPGKDIVAGAVPLCGVAEDVTIARWRGITPNGDCVSVNIAINGKLIARLAYDGNNRKARWM